MREPPTVELLWWEGCPSWPEALEDLRSAMRELGLDAEGVAVREIRTDEDAGAAGFPGSPTIRIDGDDIQPPTEGEPGGLTCRVYRQRDGRIAATPDPLDVRDALRAAVERGRRDAA
jgi:hypothetical protein